MAHEGRGKGSPSVLESLNGELMCGVCLELFDTPLLLPCGHNFCRNCVASIIDTGSEHLSFSFISVGPPNSFSCPVCQASVNLRKHGLQELPVNKALESIVFLYKNHSPVDIFDYAWNTDMKGDISQCTEHKLPQERYCDSCSVLVCKQCEKEKHGDQRARHKINGLMQKVAEHQSEIASLLTEVKKSDIQINDRIQLLEDIISGIDANEEYVTNQLDQHVNSIMATVRQQRDELKRCLTNDINEIRTPISEELKSCKALKTTIQELMKKLANIRRTRDIGLRIKLMKDSRKHLDKLLCYEIPWCVQNQEIPEVAMPSWELSTLTITEEIGRLQWKHHGMEKQRSRTEPTQKVQDREEDDLGNAQGGEASGTSLCEADSRSWVTPDKGQEVKDSADGPDDILDESQSREKLFDELDGDVPVHYAKQRADGGNIPAVVIVTPEQVKAQVSDRLLTMEKAQSLSSKEDNQLSMNEAQTGAYAVPMLPKSNGKDTSLSVSDGIETQSVPILDLTNSQSVPILDLTNSPAAEKFKKRGERKALSVGSPAKTCELDRKKDKTKKTKDKGSSSKKSSKELFGDTNTSPRTTSEALASFVARRRTMSPASSVGRSLDVWSGPDGTVNGGREESFRSSKSDTKLLALDADARSIPVDVLAPDWKHSARARSSSPSSEAHFPKPRATPSEQSAANDASGSELSPKLFSKQPISVTLDFSTDPVVQNEVRPKVKGHETQI